MTGWVLVICMFAPVDCAPWQESKYIPADGGTPAQLIDTGKPRIWRDEFECKKWGRSWVWGLYSDIGRYPSLGIEPAFECKPALLGAAE